MKIIRRLHLVSDAIKHPWRGARLFFILFSIAFQLNLPCKLYAQTYTLEHMADQGFPANNLFLPGPTKSGFGINYQIKTTPNTVYALELNQTKIELPGLSSLEFADEANLFITHGDAPFLDMPSKVYANLYNAEGKLISNFGLLGNYPYVSNFSKQGLFTVACVTKDGNGSTVAIIKSFNSAGTLSWEKLLPDANPVSVYTNDNGSMVALVSFNTRTMKQDIYFFDEVGKLLMLEKDRSSICGMAFLPDDKHVIVEADSWYLKTIFPEIKILASGRLPGVGIGRYPIEVHPDGKNFFIVSMGNGEAGSNLAITMYNVESGKEQTSIQINEKPFWLPNRILHLLDSDKLNLTTTNTIYPMRLMLK